MQEWLPKGHIFKLEFSLLIVHNIMKVVMLKFTLGNLTIITFVLINYFTQ